MSSVNKAIILGNLGADPESRFAPSGDAICNVRIATSETWKDKTTGERKEAVEWHRVTFYGKLAEIAGQYLRKGSRVYIEGSLRTRKWQDQSGQDRYSTEIRADEMKMLGKREGSEQSAPAPQQRQAPAPKPQQQTGGFGDFDDDIPFMRHAHGGAWRAV